MFISFLTSIGSMSVFLFKSIYSGICPPYYWKQIADQAIQIGYFSLPVVGMTAIFVGMAMALQCYVGFSQFTAENGIPSVVMIAMTRELGPVLTALMVAGRLGASMTAEIGTMKVTEQIDALKVLKVDPIEYLFVPRVVAGFIMMPVVVIFSSTIGLICGGVASFLSAHVSKLNYISSVWQGLFIKDINVALLKSSFFGAAIALISCVCGYLAYGGAKGVGLATTKAVVWSFVAIAIIDYIIAAIFFF